VPTQAQAAAVFSLRGLDCLRAARRRVALPADMGIGGGRYFIYRPPHGQLRAVQSTFHGQEIHHARTLDKRTWLSQRLTASVAALPAFVDPLVVANGGQHRRRVSGSQPKSLEIGKGIAPQLYR
jgi:hypothetical protein